MSQSNSIQTANSKLSKNKIYAVAGLFILCIVPLLLSQEQYYLDIVFQAFLFAALASSWNIIGGFGGQHSFGHAIFFGIGAYTTAILFMNYQISPWISIWIGMLISLFVAFIIALPTFRLRGAFFSIATLIINQLVLVLVLYYKEITNGSQGILLPYEPSFKNMIFENRMAFVYIAFSFMLITIFVSYIVLKNKLGYQLQAVRENQDASRILGVNPFWVKMNGLFISVALTSMGGSIYAMYIRFVDPYLILSVAEIGAMFVLITMIGGMGTLSGPIIGAILMMPIDILLRGSLGGVRPGLNIVVFSLLLIIVALFFKEGIVGTVKNKLEQRKTKLLGEYSVETDKTRNEVNPNAESS
ncbi:branched-chain amino acid ABC transporter permease [Neobacillus niacini]|uniref:branched-chain amino acid ABC transporter permease n=1 Tax=Neobacillus niacini TaxID=86668 RepID=UPI0021CB6CC7|nr:branched-chain amino acid ABC transporter permease [Neobacillus niacini]MCM3766200.1 branched-chain amino acid ABC transporter permease [Neobacillus niacini]